MAYAVLGPSGTFTEQAARFYLGPDADLISTDNISETFSLVVNNSVEGAVVPIDNSLVGSIAATLDGLESNRVSIQGEIFLVINQHLLANNSCKPEEIELLISQPTAMAQCTEFIRNRMYKARKEITDSTARAAQITSQESRKAACIGSSNLAQYYGLQILHFNITDNCNVTRFIHITREEKLNNAGEKTSLILSLPDTPGALYRTLEVFARRDINLIKIESRPNRNRKCSFSFYLEFDTPAEDMERLLNDLNPYCWQLKNLGSYKK